MGIPAPLRGVASVISSKAFVSLPVPTGNADLQHQTMIVTGANTGLGYETCLHLSRLGLGKLIMAVRNSAKGHEARIRILEVTGRPEASIEVWLIDMDKYSSIKAFAARAAGLPRLDGVSANAGIMTNRFELSEGIEKNINVNVVSTFLLYKLLLPTMTRSGQHTGHTCRFSVPNSALHYMAPLGELDPASPRTIFSHLNDAKTSDMAGRYALSKLLVLYAVREFAALGKDVIFNTPNPSFCRSNLAHESQDSAGFRVFERLLARTSEEGSRVLVHGLLAGPESHGQYLSNCKVEM